MAYGYTRSFEYVAQYQIVFLFCRANGNRLFPAKGVASLSLSGSVCFYLNGPMHVRPFVAQYNLPSNSDTIEEIVDETHIVYEGVNVAGA